MAQPPKKTTAITMPHIANAADLEKEYQDKLSSHLSAQKTYTRRAAKYKHQKERLDTSTNIAANKDEGGKKKESDFAVLFRTLVDAPSIAAYIAQQHNNDLRNMKMLNNFLQSISQRPKEQYAALFANHKAEVCVVLERLLDGLQGKGAANATAAAAAPSTASSSAGAGAKGAKGGNKDSAAMTPAAHEFVIRSKQHGVGRKAWDSDVTPLADAVQGALTTKQLMKALIAHDPKGHLTRMVELATNADRLLDAIAAIAGNEDASGNEKVVILTRLLSKARSLLEGEAEEAEGEGEEAAKGQKKAVKPKAERRAEKLRALQRQEEAISHEQAREIVQQLLDLSYDVFVRGKVAATGKYSKFAEWAQKRGLVAEGYASVIERIETESQNALLAQATNLELLLTLKSGEATKEEFEKVLADLTDEEKGCFNTTGVDVLSAIAVTAGKFAEDAALMDSIVAKLVNTHKEAQGTLQLPRRVMTFIAAQRQKKEQQEMGEFRKKREREDAEKFGGVHVNPNKTRRTEKATEYVEEEL